MKTYLIAIIAFTLAAWPTSAQQQPKNNSIQTAVQTCQGGCGASLRACLSSTEGKASPEICDTGLVVCTIECDDCSGALSRCVAQRGSTEEGGTACHSEMAACTQRSAAATQNRLRPMITFEGGDGSTVEAAVIIKGAHNTREGIRAEAVWILKNRANWHKDRQALLTPPGGKIYDRIEYQTPTGRSAIYFDITAFFGKM